MASVPSLTDGVVTLRAHRPDDVDDMFVMGSDAETIRWTTVPVPFHRDDALKWVTEIAPAAWRDGTAYMWAVEAESGGRPRFAGNVDVRLGPPPDIGYAMAPWARGRGPMTRAVKLATTWAFEQGVPIVHWSTHDGNLASWRVAHACGFTFHGSRPLSEPQRGELRDSWYASLRPGDPQEPRTTWRRPPVLKGKRVVLREQTLADIPRIVEACSDPRTRHWLTALPSPYTTTSARDFVIGCRLDESLGKRVSWAVADPDDDRQLANIAVFNLDAPFSQGSGEVGYWAHPDARGRGVIGEAVELVLAHAFTPVAEGGLGLRRLQLGASWGNTASRHVAERAGFTLTGRTRQEGPVGAGELDDGAWYDLLAEEWKAR
ncbi:GNAT family N-acetyltransferase [Pseudonocardia sp. TRM90224]|uniref:GNAT family N-acetyltransferase n=1 Tax=Pseudonocardia sp. TRM90224 TaxID=2812678 RepID=UPI001E600353|nr:GNAT family protein [Pseudonocardia sp. TRM90224]